MVVRSIQLKPVAVTEAQVEAAKSKLRRGILLAVFAIAAIVVFGKGIVDLVVGHGGSRAVSQLILGGIGFFFAVRMLIDCRARQFATRYTIRTKGLLIEVICDEWQPIRLNLIAWADFVGVTEESDGLALHGKSLPVIYIPNDCFPNEDAREHLVAIVRTLGRPAGGSAALA